MPGPVVVVATIVPKEGEADAVKQALLASVPGTQAEIGCLFYALNETEAGAFVTIEKWDSNEALDAHLTGPGVQALLAAAGDKLASEPVIVRMGALPAGDPAKGAL